MIDYLFLLLIGLLAGGLGGLLGIGGGIVLMPVLRFGLGLSPALAAGTTVVAVFFTTLGGGIKHYQLGHVPLRAIFPIILAGAVSSLGFSLLFPHFAKKGIWLDFGIGLVFLLVSLRMILDGVKNRKARPETEAAAGALAHSRPSEIFLGGLAGVLPGLFGIGTGAILVPGFTYLLRAPIKIAIGSALVCFAVNAFISAALKSAQGYVDYSLAIPICIGTLAGSQIGAVINHRSPSPLLRIIFGLVFSWVAVGFLLSALKAVK